MRYRVGCLEEAIEDVRQRRAEVGTNWITIAIFDSLVKQDGV